MKKKFLSFVLSICLLMPCVFALSACSLTVKEHNCSFKNEWSASQTDHWHACEVEGCKEVANKTEHNWDGGVELSQLTPTTDGVTKYTCLVCNYEKTETISFYDLETTVTEEEWETALEFDVDDLTMTVVTSEQSTTIKFDGDVVYGHYLYNEGTPSEIEINAYIAKDGSKYYRYEETDGGYTISEIEEEVYNQAKTGKQLLGSQFLSLFDEFTYDTQTGLYKAENIEISELRTVGDVEIEFKNGKVVSINLTAASGAGNMKYTFNYDEVTLTLPEVDPNVVTQAQWQAALSFAVKDLGSSTIDDFGDGDGAQYQFDGNKIYYKQTYSDPEMNDKERYYVKNGAYYYLYGKNIEGQWSRSEISEEEFNRVSISENSSFLPSMFLFEEFTYNEQTGKYEAELISTDQNMTNVALEFENGLIISFSYKQIGSSRIKITTFNYDEVTLILPEITA